ncbi:MAG: class II glutamine amidotransferase [Euryarchaeota archaeon]|nr:class II glutamine amidotransferase [Euryarchaeota archaeon]
MCRVTLVIGDQNGVGTASKILDAFVKASKREVFHDSIQSHKDGWGYVLVTFQEGDLEAQPTKVITYKTSKPVFSDETGINNLKDTLKASEEYVLIVHSRAASQGKVNAFNAHPFHFSGKSYELWIVHNGSMNSEELSKELGITHISVVSDTYLLGRYVYERLESPSLDTIKDVFSCAKGFTKTAMVTMSLFYERTNDEMHVFVTNYFKQREEYYSLYLLDLKDEGLFSVYSPTVGYYLKDYNEYQEGIEGSKIPNEHFLYVKLPRRSKMVLLAWEEGKL